jgi:homoaconitase/3-isopropylmalate dehydratase large subunit
MATLAAKERVVLCNLAVEVGAVTGIVEDDAPEGEADVVVDLDRLEPQVALPGSPSNGVPITHAVGTPVDQVFVGTCTNGWIDDLHEVADLLRGRQVHPRVRLVVTPGSTQTYLEAVRDGTVETLVAAGAAVGPATCGPCSGNHMGVLGRDDVCLSTSSRNFPGRMGHRDARVYLANPAVAAATAIHGVIADPREL